MTDSRNAATAAFLLRISLGTMFIAHALLKYFVFTLPGTAQFFASLGLPGFLGYATFAAELGISVELISRDSFVSRRRRTSGNPQKRRLRGCQCPQRRNYTAGIGGRDQRIKIRPAYAGRKPRERFRSLQAAEPPTTVG